MDLLNGVPTQVCQRGDILNRGHPAQINNKAFQRAGVVLFRVGKFKVRLLDGSAVLALKPGYFEDKLNLSVSDRQHLESAVMPTEPDDFAGFAVGTLQIVRMNRTVINGLTVKKTTFLYCTAETPKV